MENAHYRIGETMFLEGEVGDAVAYVLSGRVELIKRVGEGDVVLGEIGEGEYVGEMSVIQGLPRSATVRAKSDLHVQMLTADEFIARLRSEPDAAIALLARLSQRLRAANERYVTLEPVAEARDGIEFADFEVPPKSRPAASLHMFSGSPVVANFLPEDGLPIESLPFHVGRPASRTEVLPDVRVDLLLPDTRPYRLSRVHFSIVRDGGTFAVRDEASQLGTVINGELIGRHAPKSFARLHRGDNSVMAGGKGSPFVLRLVVGQ